MTDWSAALFPPLAGLKRSLDDVDGPLAKRMRAVYYLRTLASPEALTALSTALLDRRNSPLMRHELAYVLGQARDVMACDVLERTLDDVNEDVMVLFSNLVLSTSSSLRSSRMNGVVCSPVSQRSSTSFAMRSRFSSSSRPFRRSIMRFCSTGFTFQLRKRYTDP